MDATLCNMTTGLLVSIMSLIVLFITLLFKCYKQHWERRLHSANHDDLTGLAMRRLFKPELCNRIQAIRDRGHGSLAVLFLDVDHFKLVNDILGHDIGDQILKIVAGTLRQNIRQCDFASRMGGDEFIVLLENIKDGDIDVYAKELIGHLQRIMQQVCTDIDLGISLGISTYPFDTENPTELVNFADKALLKLKELKKQQATDRNYLFYYELDNE